jgi:hypothetical protein
VIFAISNFLRVDDVVAVAETVDAGGNELFALDWNNDVTDHNRDRPIKDMADKSMVCCLKNLEHHGW